MTVDQDKELLLKPDARSYGLDRDPRGRRLHLRRAGRVVKRIFVEIGAGELLDRLTILEIKAGRAPADTQRRLRDELDDLMRRAADAGLLAVEFASPLSDLRATNEALWQIEDVIRGCEAERVFSGRFIDLARAVYTKNDQRARIKRQLDERYGSTVAEAKIYLGKSLA